MGRGTGQITLTRGLLRRRTWPSSHWRSQMRTTLAILSSCTTRPASGRGAGSTCSVAGSALGSPATFRSATAFWSTTTSAGTSCTSSASIVARSAHAAPWGSCVTGASCRLNIGTGSRRRTRFIGTRRRTVSQAAIAAELFRRSYSQSEIYVDFVGVWDTVGALGIPIDGFRPPLLSRFWRFHDTTLSRYVLNAYHAIAIDERRRPFRPTIWVKEDDAQNQTLEQVWFAGVHCDIGGGYRDPGLSEIPLLWMAEKARRCGLAFKPDHLVVEKTGLDPEARRAGRHVVPDYGAALHDSRTR